jgi:hypothetical protein
MVFFTSPYTPGLNIKLSVQTDHANQNMWKYRYLGLLFPLKRNPDQVRQKPALELGRMWIALLAIRKGVHSKYAPYPLTTIEPAPTH